LGAVLALGGIIFTAVTAPGPAADARRTAAGLLVLYDFSAGNGNTVKDVSGAGKPLDLRIADPKAVRWAKGSLEVTGNASLQSDGPADKIIEAVQKSGELAIEAWLRPAKTDQSGPARIVTISRDSGARNVTLGQDGRRYDVRLRTTDTSENGIPSLASADNSLQTALTHIVYTHDRAGRTRIYLDGKLSREATIAGALRNWDGKFKLALANELSGDRPWQGALHLVAIYGRDLLPHEVERHFQAGPGAATAPAVAAVSAAPSDNARLFEAEIAAIFVNHCFECHDASTRKGKLDLSRKAAAFADRKGGKVIVPGKAQDSPLWQAVESNDMPEDRPPLTDREKLLLKQWIDGGAAWTTEVIDAAAYVHHGKSQLQFVRRLTVSEYIETVRSAVGVDIAQEARNLLPPDARADGFNNTAYNLNVDLGHVEAYARLAEIIVSRMDVVKFAAQFENNRSMIDDKAMRRLVENMGRWLLRGPLDEREAYGFRGILTDVNGASGDYEEGVRYLVEAFLQSPRFIYRIENQRGNGAARPVGDYELASRLSYILWGAPPDKELMRAVDAGELYDRRNLEAQVQRMLKDPRVVDRSMQFVEQWLNLGRLANLRPNAKLFPQWNARLAADMREETLAFFKEVVWTQKRPLADLLYADVTFATPQLAALYGLKPAPTQEKELVRYDLSAVPGRGGLLTQGSVLTIGGDEASMVTRGLFVLFDVLRGSVKDPPPCVDTTPVPTKRGLSKRAIAEQRVANAQCGGCHAKFEPLAYGLEKFDGIGAYHEKDEHGNRLRDDGEILFPGAGKPVKYQTSAELMKLLAGSDRVRETLTWKVAQFALGRPLGAADAAELEKVHQTAQSNGGTYESLITALVLSDLVLTTRTEAN
jgi:hypothetical protein